MIICDFIEPLRNDSNPVMDLNSSASLFFDVHLWNIICPDDNQTYESVFVW